MSKLRTLLVWPNPFHALDQEGRPAGVLPVEPTGDGVHTFDARRFVGATLHTVDLFKATPGSAQQTMLRVWFEYGDEPVEVPATAYYKHAIARGEILAADEETAKQCGIVSGFVAPEKLLERMKQETIEAYERNPPHEDLDGLAPDELLMFSFGPMADAVEMRKKRAAEAKKLEEAQKKAENDAKVEAEKAEKERAAARKQRIADLSSSTPPSSSEEKMGTKQSSPPKKDEQRDSTYDASRQGGK